MAILETLSKIGDMLTGSHAHPESYSLYQAAQEEPETERTKEAQRLWDYWIGDVEQIVGYLKEKLAVTFSQQTIDQLQFPFYNIVPRIIKRLSSAYIHAPERYIAVEYTEATKDGQTAKTKNSAQKKQAELYQEILAGSNINAQVKSAYCLAKLMDVCHVQVVWRNNHIEYDVFPSHLITVRTKADNYLEPQAILFKKFETDADGNDVERNVYWDDEFNVVLDENGEVVRSTPNPYKMLPFVTLRMRYTEDYFGSGDKSLIDINENINVLLVNGFDNAVMQSHGQAFGINLGDKGNLKTGPRYIIEANGVMEGMAKPDFKFVSPNPATSEVMAMIDWMIKTAYTQRGLPPFSASTEAMAQSGAAKEIDTQELNEMRDDDIEILRGFEKSLYKATCAVYNYHNSEKIDPNATFTIEYETDERHTSELEEWAVKEKKFNLGTWSPVWEFIDEDEGVDEAAALDIVKKNLEVRKQLNDEYGILQSIKDAFASEGP